VFLLNETDTFHPFETDLAMERMDEDSLYIMFCDIESIIIEHFNNPWNHAPGYIKPKKVEFSAGVALDKFLTLVDSYRQAVV
jgi:hypothetical protein